MKITSKSLDQTEDVAVKVLRKLMAIPPKDSAIILSLKGDLGAGKTSFAKLLGKHLGVKEEIQSPTFLILKKYKTFNPFFENFIHIDAYRMDSSGELTHLGWHDLISNPENLILIEWPERVADIMPEHIKINFQTLENETSRSIDITY